VHVDACGRGGIRDSPVVSTGYRICAALNRMSASTPGVRRGKSRLCAFRGEDRADARLRALIEGEEPSTYGKG
jgi:hypothetical protein